MDGERRIARPLRRRDVAMGPRIAARCGAVALLGFTILHGAVAGGHLDYVGSPFPRLPGKLAGLVGLAAEDVSISGLVFHDPQQILDVIGVRPGNSLIGFDARKARDDLRKLDWVARADVQRIFPNRIEISIEEREAFAVWQHNGQYQVIGRDGGTMSGFTPETLKTLPLVTGAGANVAAAAFLNQLSAMPDLMKKLHAAARVGQRRWNIYLDNGVKIALPEQGVEQALQQVVTLDMAQDILSKGIREIDLRLPDRLVVALAEPVAETDKLAAAKLAPQN